jgi:glyoxylase-like metal-dependent hydrolase (beta-lactamase superfamily II)
VLLDAGNGQDVRDIPLGRIDCGALPQVLAGLGLRPADIEVLAFTHFHADHTGWAFEPRDGGLVPFFPEAEYLVSTAETQPYRRGERPPVSPAPEFVTALLGRCRTLADGAEIAPGITAVVTPGHSAGHTSYVITTGTGRRVVAFGDVFHTPAQLAHPHWRSSPDVDPAGVVAARARITAELERPGTVGFGCHFGDQPFGTVRRDGAGVARWVPAPSTVVAPPPR